MAASADGTMTLALAASAMAGLARPADAVADANRWSEHVGVVGDDRATVVTLVESADADPDFVAGEDGIVGALTAVRQRFGTDRHVFVSATADDRATARALGWETLALTEAAAKAEWALASDEWSE